MVNGWKAIRNDISGVNSNFIWYMLEETGGACVRLKQD
jgi:hypothetical protein